MNKLAANGPVTTGEAIKTTSYSDLAVYLSEKGWTIKELVRCLRTYGVAVMGLYAKPGDPRTRKPSARLYSTGCAYYYKYQSEQYFISLTISIPTVLGARYLLLDR